jgi:2-hydroxychromene-2-carboxylate isomerase
LNSSSISAARNAYLAELALPAIERRTGVKFEYVPVLLGGIYKATNNMSPAESLRGIKNKPEYQALETQRFIRRHGITKFRQTTKCTEKVTMDLILT